MKRRSQPISSVVSTITMGVYTWCMAGDPSGRQGYEHGQLGHGNKTSIRAPKKIHVGVV